MSARGLLLCLLCACGPVGRSTPLPAGGLRCWPEERGEIYATPKQLLQCDGMRWHEIP